MVGVEEAGWLDADGLDAGAELFAASLVLVGPPDELVSSGAGNPSTKPIKPQINTIPHVKYRSIPVLLE